MGKRSSTKAATALPPIVPASERVQREKDAEELDLEERLFGTKKRRIGESFRHATQSAAVGSGDAEMDGMDDGELFMIDAPTMEVDEDEIDYEADSDVSVDEDEDDDVEVEGQTRAGARIATEAASEDEIDYEAPDAASSASGSGSSSGSDSESESDSDEEPHGARDVDILLPEDQYDYAEYQAQEAARKANGTERKCVWHDPADDMIGVDLAEVRRLKKLARGKREGEGKVGGKELASRLREQFERIHPRPAWADDRVRRGVPSLSSLFSSTKSFIDSGAIGASSRAPLPQGTVELQRLRNANQQNPTTGKKQAANVKDGVVDFAWHPNPAVPVGAVAGGDRRVRFFHIDGETNPTLLTLHIPSLPLGKITYHPTGSSLLLTGNRPYYYTYDLVAQRCIRSARNLFGSSPAPSSPNDLSRHAFSPDGSLLAVAGRRGAVSILDWGVGGGTGAVVAELVSGRGGATADIAWSADGAKVEVLGGRTGSEVEVWDVGERKVLGRVEDERAYGGKLLRKSRDGEFTAIGSSTGIVNLYSSSSFSIPPASSTASGANGIPSIPTLHPEPIKSLEHLTTEITSLDIHPSGEMLIAASKYKPKALKMYHLPSATAFSNWPTQKTPLYRVTTTNFSPSGEYLTVGNQKGQVLLWSLSHYSR